jgi:hypothetical protein
MGRYGDINRGPELNKAYIERQEWLQKTADQKQAEYRRVSKPRTDRVKPERVPAYVRPFNVTREGIYYEARGLSPTQTGAGSNVAGVARTIVDRRLIYDAPTAATDTIINVPRYRFAKITLSQRTGNGDENAKSRITGRPYTRYRTDNVSSPFGKLEADVNYQDAVQELKDTQPYKTFVASAGNSIGFTPEG